MVEINWDECPEEELRPGDYIARLKNIEERVTQSGAEYWRVEWVVDGGKHAGQVFYDSWFFSPKALPRIKPVCDAAKIGTSGRVNFTPRLFLEADFRIQATLISKTYIGRDGLEKTGLEVPFRGYCIPGTTPKKHKPKPLVEGDTPKEKPWVDTDDTGELPF